VIFGIYLTGILVSIVTGRLMRSTILRGADAPFVMELPPYRVPMLKSLLIHMWDRSKIFLRKMGGIILAGAVIVWFLTAFPRQIDYTTDYAGKIEEINAAFSTRLLDAPPEARAALEAERRAALARVESAREAERIEKSYIGRIGRALEPVFAPIGISWRGGVALLTGFVAKEIVISTLGVLHVVDSADEGEALQRALQRAGMTPLAALAMMVFVLLYLPCLATIAAIDPDICVGCRMCIGLCPYGAIRFNARKQVSEINPAQCKGCGSCSAFCPSGAAGSRHFRSRQVFAEIDGIFDAIHRLAG
jgi:ferrous iron transport protein B